MVSAVAEVSWTARPFVPTAVGSLRSIRSGGCLLPSLVMRRRDLHRLIVRFIRIHRYSRYFEHRSAISRWSFLSYTGHEEGLESCSVHLFCGRHAYVIQSRMCDLILSCAFRMCCGLPCAATTFSSPREEGPATRHHGRKTALGMTALQQAGRPQPSFVKSGIPMGCAAVGAPA